MYAHLRLHTEFSIVDGTCRIDEAVEAAARDGQGALAITDLTNLFAAVKFYSACRKAGIKPLIGCEVSVTLPGVNAAVETSRVLLLAANETGYHNLCKLLTVYWAVQDEKAQAVLNWSDLKNLCDGLVLLSGAQAGPLGPALKSGQMNRAEALAL